MKTIRSYFILLTAALLINQGKLLSQLTVHSSNGYNVNIVVLPTTVLPSTLSCTYGYNYNIRLTYSVLFTGTNIPSSLYTLQGTIGCSGGASHFFDLPNNGGIGVTNSTSNQWNSASDCATATVMSLHCNTAHIEIQGPGIASQILTFPITFTPLPVQLLSFTAEAETNDVKIKWATATEMNNNYFSIERSTDGNQWKELKRINSAGNSISIQTYEWTDADPLPGISYYRLKQTDIDNRVSFSEIKTVRYSNHDHVSIYPVLNPGNTITISGVVDFYNHELTVTNSAGVKVFATALSSATVNLPSIAPGLYFISIKNKLSGEQNSFRYLKL